MKKVALILTTLLFGMTAVNAQNGYDIYQNNSYGLPQKTGSYQQNNSGSIDIYQNNQYGLPQKTGEIKQNYNGG